MCTKLGARVDLVRDALARADDVEAELAVRRLVRRVDIARRHQRSVHHQLKWLISDSISV